MEVVTNTDILAYKELLPIVASSITAISTLCGVLIASFFNHKNNQSIAEKNIKQEKLKNNQNKIEEIYEHFCVWESSMTTTHMIHLTFYSGLYSEKEFYNVLKEQEKSDVGNSFRRIESLSGIYFPEISIAFKDVLSSRDNLAKCFFGKKQSQEACDNLEKFYADFEKSAVDFKETLRLIAQNL